MDQGEFYMGGNTGETLNTIRVGFGDGGISVEKRILAREITRDEVESLKQEILANPFNFLQPIKFPVALSCGDGRPSHSGVGDEGIKVFGGSAFFANVDLLTTNSVPAKDFAGRIKLVSEKLLPAGLLPGGHIDDHADGPNCGCGAKDKKAQHHHNLDVYGPEIKSFTENLLTRLDIPYNSSFADDILVKNRHVTEMPSGIDQMRAVQDAMSEARQGRVEKLYGPHKEVLIVLNTRPGYTLARDLINQYTEERRQVFGTDVEAIAKGAEALSGGDEEKKLRFIHGGVMWTAAVGSTLLDGSLDVLVV